jgi:penicillin-binding protein 2
MFFPSFKKIFKKEYFPKDIEPQEVLLDKLAYKKEVEMGQFEVPVSNPVIRIILIIFCACFLFLFFRVFNFQIVQGNVYADRSEKNQYIQKIINSGRGIIYDRNDKQLVYNTISFDLLCPKGDPTDQAIDKVSKDFNLDANQLRTDLKYNDNDAIVIKSIPQEMLALAYANMDGFKGCRIEKNIIREYLPGEHLSHVIGYFKDNKGMGIEFSYNDYLKSDPGIIQKERDAKGKILNENIKSQPKPGNSIVLSLDNDLQDKIARLLKNYVNQSGAISASGIAMNPQNGEVLALVSVPGFDNNIFSKGVTDDIWQQIQADTRHPFFNRAISGLYPAASTIKPFIAMAALENNIVTPKSVLDCPTKICLPNVYAGTEECFPDWKPHGSADLDKAISESVNPYFYKIAGGYKDFKGLGVEKLYNYLDQFYFGKKTGIDVPGEVAGVLPNPEWKKENINEKWSLGDTYNMAIGHGFVQVTPLQITASMCAIANGGTLYKPQLVKKILDDNGNIVKEFKPEITKENFLNKDYLLAVEHAMRQTAQSPNGTAHMLNALPVEVAAKTGTAQAAKDGYYHLWNVSYAPYEKPEIVLVLIVENVKGTNFLVLPSTYEILRWYFSNRQDLPNSDLLPESPTINEYMNSQIDN